MMWVCDAEAVNQITTRRNDFPKPTEFYGSVDLFGKNVVSTCHFSLSLQGDP